jgi:hypothetical protein
MVGAGLVLADDVGGHAELLQDFAAFDTRLGEVAGFGLVHAGRLARTERHLKGVVAVGLDGLDLGDAVVGHVEHGHGNGVAIVREDAHHAHLAAQQSEAFAQTHGASPASTRKAFVHDPDIDWPG